MEIKQGDLVTVQLEEHNSSSNVYVVARKFEGESLLNHPLFPACYILKKDTELNLVSATLKNPTEKCLEFVMKNKELLFPDLVAEVKALAAYFIIQRKLSNSQLKSLAFFCGRVASAKLDNNVVLAMKTVTTNVGLLDEYNTVWFNNFKNIYEGKKIPSPNERSSIFNQAGFVLAQLETTIVPQNR